jgi:ATP-dependent Clp protease ATP-binding subunit ClpC
VFERFTERARRVIILAREEAGRFRHDFVGTEHVLLGLIRENEGLAARALAGLGISLEDVRNQVKEIIGRGEQSPSGHIPFTPRAKKVLELSLREALQLSHNYIGTEHILLGLVREGEGVAAQVLVRLGADLERVREQVTKLLGQMREGPDPHSETSSGVRRRTPAAEQAVAAAEQLAGSGPMGSHHLLEALVRSEDSAAAKTLAALGLDADALAAKLDELGIEGTSDLTDEEAAARQMEIRLTDGEVHIVMRDETSVELARANSEHLGGSIRGDDPLAGLVTLHQQVVRFLAELQARLSPPEDVPEPEAGGVSGVIRRAIHSRLRRRM